MKKAFVHFIHKIGCKHEYNSPKKEGSNQETFKRKLAIEELENRTLLSSNYSCFAESSATTSFQTDFITSISPLTSACAIQIDSSSVSFSEVRSAIDRKIETSLVSQESSSYISEAFSEHPLWSDEVNSWSETNASSELVILPASQIREEVKLSENDSPLQLGADGINSGGGSGSSGGSGGSGHNVSYVSVSLSGGTFYEEGERIYLSYTGLSGDSTISATTTGTANATVTVVPNTSGTGGQIIIQTVDDFEQGDDKYLSVQVNLNGTSSQFSSSTQTLFNFTIIERPEFLSHEDQTQTSGIISYNNDTYTAYVEAVAESDTAIHLNGSSIIAKGSQWLRYSLVTPSPYFEINSLTGVIRLKSDVEDMLIDSDQHLYSLTIRAYESRMINGASGGTIWSDDATVNISIAEWNIGRNGSGKAGVTPVNGCTIASLAKQAGFNEDEYLHWLTVVPDVQIQLFDGTYKLSQEITTTDVLATSNYVVFSVPNTIYAVWCWNPLEKQSMNWHGNLADLSTLGYKVITFENTNFETVGQAKAAFIQQLYDLSDDRELHGLYLTGHGSTFAIETTTSEGITETVLNSCFGVKDDPNGEWNNSWGPRWYIEYGSSSSFSVSDENSWGIGNVLKYKLAAFIGHSCYSTLGDSSLLWSRNARYWGCDDTFPSSWKVIVVSLWGMKFNNSSDSSPYATVGLYQGTHRIYNYFIHLLDDGYYYVADLSI